MENITIIPYLNLYIKKNFIGDIFIFRKQPNCKLYGLKNAIFELVDENFLTSYRINKHMLQNLKRLLE